MRHVLRGIRNWWHRDRFVYIALGAVVALLAHALAGIAYAQEAVGELPTSVTDLREIFANPVYGVAAIVGAVRWVRLRWPQIDGPIAVPALAIAIGALSGALGQFSNALTVLPFSEWSFPWGGLLYGTSLAITGVIGVNVFELAASKLGKLVLGAVVPFLKGGGGAPATASNTRTDADQFLSRR
jgi:hypothetical protein